MNQNPTTFPDDTYQDKMVEMPPEEILTEREGTAYPSFEKYTYYSRTGHDHSSVTPHLYNYFRMIF